MQASARSAAHRRVGSAVALVTVLALLGPLWLQRRARPPEPSPNPAPAPAPALRTPGESILDERAARAHFKLDERAAYRYDPIAYLLPEPNRRSKFRWEEHPSGSLLRRTNNLGFNEDQPTSSAKHGLRVLVAGDSHTAGVVENSESFCNIAERELQRLLARPDVEVLNAGVGHTSPTCYLGVLRRYLQLDPDVFVAVLFVGNDFCDESYIGFQAGRWPRPKLSEEYLRLAAAGMARWEGPFAQGLNQAYRWRHFPDEPARVLGAVVESYRSMQALCDERGIRFLAVMLPTKMDIDEDDRESWNAAMEELGLDAADVARNLEQGRRFLEQARTAGIETLDPTEALLRSDQALYGRRDYHLNVDGHALLGLLLAREVERLLGH